MQPENKETAPGLLLPLLWVARRAPAATVAVFPADHFVWDEHRFAIHVRSATAAAQDLPDRLTLLGVEADAPDMGYGWIAPGEPLAAGPATELYTVGRFWEKPDRSMAAHLFSCGYFWNTLVLAGHVRAYLGLAEACAPRVLGPLRAVQDRLGTPGEAQALTRAYDQITPTDLSRTILARRQEWLLVLAARGVGWSDWGDPDRILRTLRRFDRRPNWLPAYVQGSAQAAADTKPR